MANPSLNTLLIRKPDGAVKDSLGDFGMATGQIPWPAELKVKDPGTVDCPGESGERVYFPENACYEAYDLKIEFLHRDYTHQLYEHYKTFRDFLTKGGTELEIYSPWYGIGRGGVYVKGISEVEFKRDETGQYATMEVEFRVTDPETDVLIVKPE